MVAPSEAKEDTLLDNQEARLEAKEVKDKFNSWMSLQILRRKVLSRLQRMALPMLTTKVYLLLTQATKIK